MATTFNFTVRAEDDAGAFADRDFSMTVRNTIVDRYMITDANDAYTSPDMVTWTKRNGQGGVSVAYGGGKWFIKTGTFASATYRLSSDGVSFSNYTASIPGHTTFNFTSLPVWNNDRWIAPATAMITGVYWQFIVQSMDGVTWEPVVSWLISAGSLRDNVALSFYEDKIYCSLGTNPNYIVVDTTTKTYSVVTPAYPSVAAVGGSPLYSAPMKVNDLWIVMVTGASGGSVLPLYSNDRISWSAGSVVTGTAGSSKIFDKIYYCNGRLIATGVQWMSASSIGFNVLLSVDGKNWSLPTTPPPSSGGGNTPAGSRQSLIPAKGNLFISFNKIGKSTDLGLNWTDESATFPVPVFASTGIAAIL